jgi:hypothetical protein
MTTIEHIIAPPERFGGQGLDHNQEESGNRAIIALLTDATHGHLTDIVATYRHGPPDEDGIPTPGSYEVWAQRGMVRFRRFYAPDGGYGYEVIEQIGENPVGNQDPTALATLAEELEAGAKSGFSGSDPAKAFVEPQHLSHPLAYERIAQLFDSPNGPDLVVSPKSYAWGRQPGQHGSIDVVQSRAPLVFSGPGIRNGTTDALCAQVDIAPTLARLLDFPLVDGMDSTGRTSSERGVPPDVYLKRQDGKVIESLLDPDGWRPERAYIFLLDGLSNTELKERLEHDRESIPALARLIEHGAMFEYGTIVNFPSITWPSHNALGTGAWCGHHDIVNPTYHLRETKETITPQGMTWDTGKYLGSDVETFYEAVHRVRGKWDPQTKSGAVTASINEPCSRGAGHSTLEREMLVPGEAIREVARENKEDTNPRWKAEGQEGCYRYSGTDMQGMAQALLLFDNEETPPPTFTYHEFSLNDSVGHDYGPHSEAVRDSLIETDKRIAKILALLDRRGLFDSTLFVVTTDHGMAPIDTALAADQVRAVPDAGIKSVTCMPLVYLIDMDVTVAAAPDGRTVTVTVRDNDADERGERLPVAGARIEVAAPRAQVVAEATTDAHGVAGLPLPANVDPGGLVVVVHHDSFNSRHLRLDGTNVVRDPRERLYSQ